MRKVTLVRVVPYQRLVNTCMLSTAVMSQSPVLYIYMYIYTCSTYIWHDNAINIISHVFIGSNTAMLVQKLFHFQKEKKCGLCSEVHCKSRDKRHCPQTICLLCLQTGHSKASCYEARAIRKTFCKRCRQRGHQAKVSGNYMQQRL